MINDLFIPRERCNKLQLLSLSCVNNLQFNRLRLFELNYFEFPVNSNLNQFPFGLDLPFTHLLSVILNSRYFKLFLFPLTVQNNVVQLYDNDYKNNKKFVPGGGISLPTKEVLIMKTIFYSILAEPQKMSKFCKHWRHYLSTLAERIMVSYQNEAHLVHEFFFGHFPLHEIFLGFFPTPPPSHHFSNGPSLIDEATEYMYFMT